MFPSPTRNYTKAILTGVVSLVLLIPQVIAVIRLFAGPGYPGVRIVPPFIFVMLAGVQFTLIFSIVQLVRTEQALRAAMRGDDRVAPPVLTQPDRLQAMRHGEQLTFEWRMRTPVFWRGVGLLTVLVPLEAAIVTYFGEAFVFLAAPHASGWILAWVFFNRRDEVMYVPPPHLAPFEWCLVASPIVLAMAVGIYLIWGSIWEALSSRHPVITITCTDYGIAVKWSASRRVEIPWNEVHLLLDTHRGSDGGGPYWLRGERHGLILNPGPTVRVGPDGEPLRPAADDVGGIDAYEADCQRLLATITLRAHVPLRTWAGGYYSRTRDQQALPFGLTADEVTAMPLAGAHWQPPPEAVAAAATTAVTLSANIPLRPLLRRATRYGLFFGVPLLLLLMFIGLAASGGSFSRAFPGLAGLRGILSGAAFVCLVYAVSVLAAVNDYRADNPAIMADSEGLTAIGFSQKPLYTISWMEMLAWGMVEPAPGEPAAVTYAIYTDIGTVIWTEPANAKLVWQRVTGDRRAAYRAAPERLHATIAARTDLPLHLILPRS